MDGVVGSDLVVVSDRLRLHHALLLGDRLTLRVLMISRDVDLHCLV